MCCLINNFNNSCYGNKHANVLCSPRIINIYKFIYILFTNLYDERSRTKLNRIVYKSLNLSLTQLNYVNHFFLIPFHKCGKRFS